MEIFLDYKSSKHLAKLCQYKDVEMPPSVFVWAKVVTGEIVCREKAIFVDNNRSDLILYPAYTLGEFQNWLPMYIGVPGYGVTLEMKVDIPMGKPWTYKYGYSIGITKDAPDFSDENPLVALYELVCWAIENEYIKKEPVFENKFGAIPQYTEVSFAMKDPEQWQGDTTGTLLNYVDGWKINTTDHDFIDIDGNDELDRDSIQPIKE